MSLKEKVESLYVAVCGNRVTFIAGLWTATICTTNFVIDQNEHPIYSVFSGLSCLLSGSLLGLTNLGTSTLKHYKRTLREMEEKGSIDSAFFEERILRSENRSFVGYCQLQGLYLGAKSTGSLDTFYEAKEKVSNCRIPNF